MTLEASQKVPEGKMVKLQLEVKDEKVEKARIRGDFFLEPPEKLGKLENRLQGLKTETGKDEVAEKLEKVNVDMIGFSAKDVAEAFQKALEAGKDE